MFDKGRVIESGTFDELVENDGYFAKLAKAQFMVQEKAGAGLPPPMRCSTQSHETCTGCGQPSKFGPFPA